VLHIFSPAHKSTYETKRKLRTAAKIKTQDYKIEPIRTPPLNTATKLFNKPDRKWPFGTLIDKKYLRDFAWFLSQAITWFATDRNVQWKKSMKTTQVKVSSVMQNGVIRL